MSEHVGNVRERNAARSITWALVACMGALGLVYSKDSPAPPPPVANCSSGIPASLGIQFTSPPLNIAVNSHLSTLLVQAFDVAGNPLRDIPITFTAPASGPSGTFNVFTDPDNETYVATPDPLTTTVSTSSTCDGAAPLFIANTTLGNYQIIAAGGATATLPVAIANVSIAAVSVVNVFGAKQIAHVNTPFKQRWWAQTVLGSSGEVAGVPVTFNVPTSGPSGTFAGGSTSASAPTNAFGRAYAPILTANDEAGHFNVTASAPGATSVEAGPLINGGTTVTSIERPSEVPATTVFGRAVTLVARVRFIGLTGTADFFVDPNPSGNVVLKSDGIVIANEPLDDNHFSTPICHSCTDRDLTFHLTSTTIPFGSHQLTAEYQSNGLYDSSTSSAITQTVLPEFTGPTASTGVLSSVGITGSRAAPWGCVLSGAEWTSVASAGAPDPPGYAIPFGLFRYRMDLCRFNADTIPGAPLPRLVQVLVLQFTEPLPPGAVFLNYGPSLDNPSPHWYQVQSTVNGNLMQVMFGDGDLGDDDLMENGVIAGLGGPAVLQGQPPIPNVSYEGLWWNAPAGSESGWGINFAHQGNVIFATWFTYDATGKGWWLAMTAPNTGGSTFVGTLYQATGPAFDAVPFDPTQVVGTPVGTGTLTFADASNGTFGYTVNGISQTKNITREVFGVLPTCNFNFLNDLATASNYQDIWWKSPAGSESGWGISLIHQGDTIFGTWFTYDLDHTPMWLVVTANRSSPTTYSGDLFRTTGPPFNAVPFDTTAIHGTKVGTATFSFVDGSRGSFSYTVNATSQSKTITREVFRTPGTVCH